MNRIIFLLAGLFFFLIKSMSQEVKEDDEIQLKLSGYVKSDFIFDSRQNFALREGHFLLWPLPIKNDQNGNDIYAKPNFNFLALQSRLTLSITGPNAFNAKTSGVIEGDFFGQANDNINLLRLRQAYIKFTWTKAELILGQYWNPMFLTKCFPAVISFNTGAPFQPFARNPQVRFTYSVNKYRVLIAALSQRDYSSRGINGASGDYLRNSNIPDIHFQVHYENKYDPSGSELFIGAGVSYKTIVPRLYSEVLVQQAYDSLNAATGNIMHVPSIKNNYEVDEKVSGLSAIFFFKYAFRAVTFKFESVYGENDTDVLSLSGFAVKGIADSVTGRQDYTPVRNATVWGEIHTNGKRIQLGIFGGYSKNLGTKESINDKRVYGLITNLESIYRISPRIVIKSGKIQAAGEVEYSYANFGKTDSSGNPELDSNGVPSGITGVSNLRFLMAVYYFF